MNINMNGSGKVVIDGREFNGRNVQISGNKVIVDGVTQDGEIVRMWAEIYAPDLVMWFADKFNENGTSVYSYKYS